MSNIEELNDQLIVRRQKMADISESGLDPFGSRFERTHLSNEVIAENEQFDKDYLHDNEREVVIAGLSLIHI